MALEYTIKAGTVNGTTEFNSINAAVTYFKAGDRMGAGVATVAAGDSFDLVFEGFLDFAGSTQILSGITLANNATSRVRMRGGANRWNASPSNAAGVTATRDGFKVNSSAQFTSSPGQPGLEIIDLVIEGGSTGNYLLHLFGSSSARGLVQGCLILLNTGAAMSLGTISTGYTDFRRNFVILANAGADSVGMRAGGFDDPSLFDHNTVVCLSSAPTGSYGMRLDGSGHTARNNVVVGFATDYNGAGFGTATGNASSDATAPGSSALTSVAKSTANFESVTGSGDFRVKATSVLKTTGAARLATELVDGYGQTRADPATPGAHEAGATDTTAPLITGPSGSAGDSTSSKSQAEGATAVHTFTANEAVTWDLNGGADVAMFSINSSTGALSFLAAPDFEDPDDAGTNNTYVVGVRATDGASNAATQTVTVTITNANEAPTFTGTISVPTLTEGAAMTPYATAGFFGDPDAGDTAAYSAIGSWPAGVTVNSSTGVISGTPTTPGTYASLQVRRTDSGSLTVNSNTFTITVAAAGGVTFTGTVPGKNGTVGTAFAFGSPTMASYFSGAGTYALQSGTLPPGLSVNASTGAIEGTPTTAGTYASIVVRKTATSGSPATADTNGFTITIAPAPVLAGFDLHTAAGCRIGNISGSMVDLGSSEGVELRVHVLTRANPPVVVASSGLLTTNSNGRVGRFEHASIALGTSYTLLLDPTNPALKPAVRTMVAT